MVLKYDEESYFKIIEKACPSDLWEFLREKFNRVSTVSIEDLRQHAVFVAGTTTGKSTLLSTVLDQLFVLENESSFIVIDPHGDIVNRLSTLRMDSERVMYFTLKYFSENQNIFTYNVFDVEENDDLSLSHTIEQIVNAISELPLEKGHSLSAGMNSLLMFCLKFIIKEIPNPTLLDLYNLLELKPGILNKAQEYDQYFKKKFTSEESKTREAVRRRVGNAIKTDVIKVSFVFRKFISTRSSTKWQ